MQVKRYSDEELEEFREIINKKLKIARQSYSDAMQELSNKGNNTDADTAPTYHILEEGTEVIERENLIQKAQREYKFIQSLEAALIRKGSSSPRSGYAWCLTRRLMCLPKTHERSEEKRTGGVGDHHRCPYHRPGDKAPRQDDNDPR